MGMYTELSIGIELKSDTPKAVIDVLEYMARGGDTVPAYGHPLFETDRWDWMLRSGGSYYFDAKPSLYFGHDDIPNAWFLSVRTNIKNYCSEWEKFLDWLCPFIDTQGYLGTYRYEESDDPTLVYKIGNEIVWHSVTGPKQ